MAGEPVVEPLQRLAWLETPTSHAEVQNSIVYNYVSNFLEMSHRHQSERIEDNPSSKSISDLLPLMRVAKSLTGFAKRLGIKNDDLHKIHQTVDDLLKQSDIVKLPDRFNDAFAKKGWIATSSMSVDTMERALQLHGEGKLQLAEDEILAWFQPETINHFAIKRTKKFNKARTRWDQLQEALKLTLEERYWAAVPLILIACDGFASDVLDTSPFEKDADLTAFDSITGHPNSLPFLIRTLTKGIRRSSDEELKLPLRHGILHGKSLGYATRPVCMKAWLLMIALVDWAVDKSSESERVREHQAATEVSLVDLAEKLRRNAAVKRTLDEFQPRENLGPFDDIVDEDSPEFAVLDFLTCWKSRNFGGLARRAVNLHQQSVNKLAGQLRQDTEFVELNDFKIQSLMQSAVARAEAIAFLEGKTLRGTVKGEFLIVAFRYTTEGDIAMPTDAGHWSIRQDCIFDLMRGQTFERKRRERT